MGWGIATWNAAGVANNTGLVPFLSAGSLTCNQTTAATVSMTYAVPGGQKLSYIVQDSQNADTNTNYTNYYGYNVTISGNTLSITRVDGTATGNRLRGYSLTILASTVPA